MHSTSSKSVAAELRVRRKSNQAGGISAQQDGGVEAGEAAHSASEIRPKRRNVLQAGLLGAAVAGGLWKTGQADAQSNEMASFKSYVDNGALRMLPFGTHSHYIQPWRVRAETVSAAQLLQGTGVVLNDGPRTSEATLATLSAHGIRHVRLEISWSELDYLDLTRMRHDAAYRRVLRACGRHGLRPLILLNAHHGLPVPTLEFSGRVLQDAAVGDKHIRLHTAGTIVPGLSGLSNMTDFWAAELLVLKVDDGRVLLSKPLPKPLRQGDKVTLATLRYSPFDEPGSASTFATLAGWQRYVSTIVDFVASALGTTQSVDRGFDLEIWNELSFGSKFLSSSNYYENKPRPQHEDGIWAVIVDATAGVAANRPQAFAGVRMTNGFASTVPWPNAAAQPPAVSAISKHPYGPQKVFPADEQRNTVCLDASARSTTFVPSYRTYFPEYYATGIQTETVMRDIGPDISDIYGSSHGRTARRIDGRTAPVPVWITEIGVNPAEVGVKDARAAMRLKAVALARAMLFYLNQGAERVYLYAASEADADYAVQGGKTAADADRPLRLLRRVLAAVQSECASESSALRTLQFSVATTQDSAIQFDGDGTPANPPMRNIDMLALLPFQTGPRRFAIAYYFITRDLRVPAKTEQATISIGGVDPGGLSARVYDPSSDQWRDHRVRTASNGNALLTLEASDAPRILMLHEAEPATPANVDFRRLHDERAG